MHNWNLFKSLKSWGGAGNVTRIKGQTKAVKVNNKEKLNSLRESTGQRNWKKVYEDGYDEHGQPVSVHYFRAENGLIAEPNVKQVHSLDK